jgi:DNA-binding GntR family transcriptional regulator
MDLHENVMWHVHRERHRVNFGESVTSDSASSHADVLQAILNGKPEAAGLAMRGHLEHVGRLMLAHRQGQTAAALKPVQANESASRTRGKRAVQVGRTANQKGSM